MNVFEMLGHELTVPWIYISTGFSVLLLLVAGLRVRAAIATSGGGVIPDEGLSVRNVIELLVEYLGDLGESTIGSEWKRYFPIVGTIFLFVLVSNMMSLVPFLLGSTSDINVTVAWAIISWGVANAVGIQKHGFNYIYHFTGPALFHVNIAGKHIGIRILMPLFLPLELLLNLARVLTLAVRLLANMFADHTVVMVWIGLVPVVVPAIFMGLGLLVSFLQAFVFALLTMIYIGEALHESH